MSFFLLLFFDQVFSFNIGFYNLLPYSHTTEDCIALDIWQKISTQLGISYTIINLANETQGIDCVNSGSCDACITGIDSQLTLSYPLFYDRGLLVTVDKRPGYVSKFLWQFLILIVSIWLPLLIIVSHIIYFVETRILYPNNYPLAILNAIWLMVTFSTIKKPYAKIWALISGIFLLFVMMLIIADLSSSIANANLYGSISTENIMDMDLCAQYWTNFNTDASHDTLKNCLNDLKDEDYDGVLAGRLELSYFVKQHDSWNDDSSLILHDTISNEIFFHLGFSSKNTELLTEINKILQDLWTNKVIFQITQKYYENLSINYREKYTVIFRIAPLVLAGLTIIIVFIGALLVIGLVKIIKNKKEVNQKEIEDGANSSRALLSAREHGNTLSLERSNLRAQQGAGRPEGEWVNKAVNIEDENAHKIKNIQDYENELSAVPPARPSLVASDSLASLFKPEKSKTNKD
ncbi:unnamed protein product [Blepharisma stoltei]|uniref:Uncharacterized protein n=1 Tax=Blepharisma stoltei TaxID=1481888 RepID=A0AAU9KB77_9CILI|nr:unnamed protein product [Blepharisma stoltei]